jgi:hypothetical protein
MQEYWRKRNPLIDAVYLHLFYLGAFVILMVSEVILERYELASILIMIISLVSWFNFLKMLKQFYDAPFVVFCLGLVIASISGLFFAGIASLIVSILLLALTGRSDLIL